MRIFERGALLLLTLALGVAAAHAEDRPFDRDWRTGVTVAPGAQTWTADHFKEKQELVRHAAAARGKTCGTDFAALAWAPGNGGPGPIMDATRKSYEAAGYKVEEKPGDIDTERVWLIANPQDSREAAILWGEFQGSTIYVSCLTAGSAAADPDKPLYLAALLALGLGSLGAGLWLVWRTRALGAASTTWPTTPGIIKSSEVASHSTQGGYQHSAKVTYDYTVGGASYAGDRVRFGARTGTLEKAQAEVAKYPAGTAVPVHYAPHQPQTATLEPGIAGWSVWGLVLAGIGLALTALAVAVAVLV